MIPCHKYIIVPLEKQHPCCAFDDYGIVKCYCRSICSFIILEQILLWLQAFIRDRNNEEMH